VLNGNRPEIPGHWPSSLKVLLQTCWHESPDYRPLFKNVITDWEHMELDLLCPDPLAKQICERLWEVRNQSVNFSEFKEVFTNMCMQNDNIFKKKPLLLKYLNTLLCKNPYDDEVTFQRFCSMIGWFGPLDRENSCKNFFARIKDTFSQKFFHAFISENKAQNELKLCVEESPKNNNNRYYLCRFSYNDVGEFIFSFIDDGEIYDKRILNINGKYWVESLLGDFETWDSIKQVCKSEYSLGSHVKNNYVK